MKKIVFFNTKGGTGKTTVCYNYGWYLAEKKKKKVLKNLFEKTVDIQDYDFVLIDSQPNFSLLSSTSLIYAKNVVVVARPDLFSFLDIDYLKRIIGNLNKKYFVNIKVNCILINAFEKRRRTSKEGVINLNDKYGEEFNILQNKIKYLSAFQTSISEERKPVFLSYPRSDAAKNILEAFSELDDSVDKIYHN